MSLALHRPYIFALASGYGSQVYTGDSPRPPCIQNLADRALISLETVLHWSKGAHPAQHVLLFVRITEPEGPFGIVVPAKVKQDARRLPNILVVARVVDKGWNASIRANLDRVAMISTSRT